MAKTVKISLLIIILQATPEVKDIEDLRKKHPENVIISFLNINSIRNKFKNIMEVIGDEIDVINFGETKLDDSFPKGQFKIPGCKTPYRLDVTACSGGLMVLISKGFSSKTLNRIDIASDMQIIPIELNLSTKKWLLLLLYRPPHEKPTYFKENLQRAIDFFSHTYDNIITLGDFNMDINEATIRSVMENNGLVSLINSPTSFKSTNGRCIDLIMTTSKNSCICSSTFETGISDFHHMVYTILKTTYDRLPPKVISYRCYRNFSESQFREELAHKMYKNSPKSYAEFENQYVTILNSLALKKSVSIRGNNKPHMSKKLRNAIMKRARLRNRANLNRKDLDMQKYKLQRNLVVSMNREAKRDFYRNLDPQKVGKEKDFWRTFKPLVSDKEKNTNTNMQLIENGNIITKRDEIAECFNSHFTTITETLNIEKAPTSKIIEPFSHPVIDAIKKFRLHQSIVKIRQINKKSDTFQFHPFEPAEVWDEINRLDTTKKTSGDVPTHILKLPSDLSFSAVTKLANELVQKSTFPD